MLFNLKLELDDSRDIRLQLLDGLTSAMDTIRHEDTFSSPGGTVSAASVDLFGVDSNKIGRMILLESPEPEQH